MRHKHADVLIAISEGKEVECRFNCNKPWHSPTICNPLDQSNIEWRIKPEPKPDGVMYVKVDQYSGKHSDEHYVGTSNAYIDSSKIGCSNLKLTFDGETGKLKSAEVINEN